MARKRAIGKAVNIFMRLIFSCVAFVVAAGGFFLYFQYGIRNSEYMQGNELLAYIDENPLDVYGLGWQELLAVGFGALCAFVIFMVFGHERRSALAEVRRLTAAQDESEVVAKQVLSRESSANAMLPEERAWFEKQSGVQPKPAPMPPPGAMRQQNPPEEAPTGPDPRRMGGLIKKNPATQQEQAPAKSIAWFDRNSYAAPPSAEHKPVDARPNAAGPIPQPETPSPATTPQHVPGQGDPELAKAAEEAEELPAWYNLDSSGRDRPARPSEPPQTVKLNRDDPPPTVKLDRPQDKPRRKADTPLYQAPLPTPPSNG